MVVVATTAEAECNVMVLDVILGSATLLAPLLLHFLHHCHRCAAAPGEPPGLLAKDSRIRFVPPLADVLPLWPVVKTPTVTTLTEATLLVCKVAMVHSNPPFWPPVFSGSRTIIIHEIK